MQFRKGGNAVIMAPIMKWIPREMLKPLPPCPDAPDFAPELWAGKTGITCYAYAMGDMRERTVEAHPGGKSGVTHAIFCRSHPSEIIGWLVLDGLVRAPEPVPKPGCYLVAAALRLDDGCGEGPDIHFWRQDSDGLWSHKPGNLAPGREDFSGRKIILPHASDCGRYDEFLGYFYAPKGGLSVEPWPDISPAGDASWRGKPCAGRMAGLRKMQTSCRRTWGILEPHRK